MSGRVEIYYSGEWGTVNDYSWGQADTDVVCRQLGCTAGTSECCATFGAGSGQIWMDEVSCTGAEPGLADCAFDHSENVWGDHD